MDIIDKTIIGAGLIGVGYVVYTFKDSFKSSVGLVDTVAKTTDKVLNTAIKGTTNTLDYGTGAISDLFGGNSTNPIKTTVQNAAKKSAVATTTLYDNVTNDFSIGAQKVSNFFTGANASTDVTRYLMSKDNDRNVGVSVVANTFLVDNNEKYLGAESNILNQSTTLKKEALKSYGSLMGVY